MPHRASCLSCRKSQYYNLDSHKNTVFICRKLHLANVTVHGDLSQRDYNCSCPRFKRGDGYRSNLNNERTFRRFERMAPEHLVQRVKTFILKDKLLCI